MENISIKLGKINKNKIQEAIRDLEWKGKTRIEKRSYLDYLTGEYKEDSTKLTEPFGDIDTEVLKFIEIVYNSHNRTITEENFKEFLLEIKAYSESYSYKINDIRQTEEELIKQKKEREEQNIKIQEEEEKKDKEIKANGNLTQSEKISLSTSEISKQIKQKLKNKYKNCEFSVVTQTYSGGSNISISLMKSNFKVIQDQEELSEEAINKYCDRGNRTIKQLKEMQGAGYHQLNSHIGNDKYNPNVWNNGVFLTEEGFNLFKGVMEIVNFYNYDHSDSMTDYYDVNFYTHLNIGKWDKPYILEESINKDNTEEIKSQDIEVKQEIEFIKNEDKNGLEVYFKDKPSEEIRAILKNHGFRWGRFNKCWYKTDSEGLQETIKKALEVV